jgi:hypothetical protein
MKNVYLTLYTCLILCFTNAVSAQVPKLNSYPAASAVIFLDFDGHLVQGTSWNYNGSIACNSANLTNEQLTEVYNRVAEDYRPFNINVTTDSTKYWSAPAKKRMRLVLTTSSSWYGSAGGVAYTNSFVWGDNTPCFVFTALLNYNVKFISEAASHEVGHTLGLNHQSSYDAICNKTNEYNSGNGAGETGWAPIMGLGYYRNLSLWHYGSNPWGCSYMQDDLTIISNTANGFGFRTDDHSNTKATATALNFVQNSCSSSGVVERPNDADLFTFALNGTNRIQLNALPFSVSSGYEGANIDLRLEIINASGDTTSYNPLDALKVSIDTLLPAGTYYLRVSGTGNSYAPDFASLGSYMVDGAIVPIMLPVHKLELKAVAENNRHRLNWEIVADETVVEQIIESATDGVSYQPLTSIGAASRSFGQPAQPGTVYYRLKVTFDNGRVYYSNVALLKGASANSRPYLVSTVTGGTISVNSPSLYAYAVVDLQGRQVAKGQLIQGLNTLTTAFLPDGLYILQYSNNQEQYTEKFMKK